MKKMVSICILILSSAVYALSLVPIVVGGNDDFDACMSVGIIKNVKVDLIANMLAVRSGPSKKYSVVDKLKSGSIVWMCSNKGKWVGVVYPGPKVDSCEVSSPINPAQTYKGRCKSGWIHNSSVGVAAG